MGHSRAGGTREAVSREVDCATIAVAEGMRSRIHGVEEIRRIPEKPKRMRSPVKMTWRIAPVVARLLAAPAMRMLSYKRTRTGRAPRGRKGDYVELQQPGLFFAARIAPTVQPPYPSAAELLRI